MDVAAAANVLSLAAGVEARLTGQGPRWFDGLAGPLARSKWDELRPAGLNRANYGTCRFMASDPGAGRDEIGAVILPDAFGADAPVIVERLHGAPARRYSELGLRYHQPGELAPERAVEALQCAFARLAEVPGAARAIGDVLAAVHVVRPDGPEYDVSCSDPAVPFSIFIGIDAADQKHGDLRLAEGILHECMHLQLTLIEEAVPLIAGKAGRYHSPWTGTLRPAQGLLHGLYVFRAIQDFCRRLLSNDCCSPEERAFLERRVQTIEGEIAEIVQLGASPDLTPAGARFVDGLSRSW